MKTRILTILLSVFSVFTFAQITVTDADILGIGDVIYQAFDDMPSSSISTGNTGANQSWDFSSLNISISDSESSILLGLLPFDRFGISNQLPSSELMNVSLNRQPVSR